MIDPKLLRNDPEGVARNLARRGYRLDVAALRALEERRKPQAMEVERLRAERNANARAVGLAKARGEEAAQLLVSGEGLAAALGARKVSSPRYRMSSSNGSSACRTCCTSRYRTAATRAPTSS